MRVKANEEVTIENCTFEGSTSSAIVLEGGTLNIINSSITDCETTGNGGAIRVTAGTLNIEDTMIEGNSAANGGAIFASGANIEINIDGSTTIKNNSATNGGALYVSDTSASGTNVLNINSATIDGNTASGSGLFAYAGDNSGEINFGDVTFENAGTDDFTVAMVRGDSVEVTKSINVQTYVDGVPSIIVPVDPEVSLSEQEGMPKSAIECCGWFADADLTKKVTIESSASCFPDAAETNVYTKSASDLSNFTFTLNSDGASYNVRSSSTSISGAIVIPAAYNDGTNGVLPITSTADATTYTEGAFAYCKSISTVTFPEKFKTVCDYAFAYSSISGTFATNESMTTIESRALNDCIGISKIVVEKNISSIGQYAFRGCTGVTEIVYDAISVADHTSSSFAFQNVGSTSGSVKLTIGNSVTKIPAYLFHDTTAANCPRITSVTIGANVKSIGEGAFGHCTKITSVEIPDSVISVGGSVFGNCTGLQSVKFGKGVTSIGGYMFDSCSSLVEVIVPEDSSIQSIGHWAFTGCSALSSIYIPDSVTSFSYGSFAGCTSLTSVYIPSSVQTIVASTTGHAMFAKGSSTMKIYCGAASKPSGWGTYWNYYDSSNTLEVVWGVTRYDYEIAVGLRVPLVTVVPVINNVPKSGVEVELTATYDDIIVAIGVSDEQCCGWFTDDIYMTTFKPEEHLVQGETLTIYTKTSSNNSNFIFELNSDGLGYNVKALNDSISGDIVVPSKATDGTNGVLPVTSIGLNAFKYCTQITNILLPGCVVSIEDEAFFYCYCLTSITIPDSVTSIGGNAFFSCIALNNIIISDSVTSIEHNAFYECYSLKSFDIPKNLSIIDSGTFKDCSGLTSITIPDSVTSIGNHAFSGCKGLTSITIPDLVTSIEYSAFYDCTRLTEINYNAVSVSDLTSTSNIFSNAGSVSGSIKVSIGDNVEKIPAYLFYNCSNITSLTIGDSVTSIGNSAFNGCTGLTSIYIPSSVTTISASSYSNSPFYGCSSSLKIYCGAASKPSGWSTYWNRNGSSSSSVFTVTWGVTREQYEANYANVSDTSAGVMASASAMQTHTELTTIMMTLTIVVCAVISVVAGITLKKKSVIVDDVHDDDAK